MNRTLEALCIAPSTIVHALPPIERETTYLSNDKVKKVPARPHFKLKKSITDSKGTIRILATTAENPNYAQGDYIEWTSRLDDRVSIRELVHQNAIETIEGAPIGNILEVAHHLQTGNKFRLRKGIRHHRIFQVMPKLTRACPPKA